MWCEILTVIISLSALAVTRQINEAELFNKDEKMDKLVLTNQIGYHFKRVVREVSQELFVSRKVDVSAIFHGILVLNETQKSLVKYCNGLSKAVVEPTDNTKVSQTGYIHCVQPDRASFSEAKARCEALGMQLPEVYTQVQLKELNAFLIKNNIKITFAGIQPDPLDAIHRFISTGFPIWRMPQDQILDHQNRTVTRAHVIDDLNAKFQYRSDGNILASWDDPSVIYSNIGDHQFRTKQPSLSQLLLPIVCEPKWDGRSYTHFRSDTNMWPELPTKNRFGRSINVRSTENRIVTRSVISDSRYPKNSLKEYCLSVSEQASEVHQEMTTKMSDLLSLVDISIQIDSNQLKQRKKRSAFLATFVFSTGVRLIWSLFGFMQRMRLNKKVDRIDGDLSIVKGQVDVNTKTINNMSAIIYGQSIAINQLQIATRDLDLRVTEIEKKLQLMEQSISDVLTRVEVTLALSLVANLILRIQHSISNGYHTLEDIIHCSLLGQTSPLLLPVDQIVLVQTEVQKVSTGTLDTDFSRMQSIVVSDPSDPHLLLVVINVAALSRQNVELIKLVPIPYFENDKAFSPVLDYDTIVLDQLSRTYSILSEQEEYDCLFNRCYISDIERSVNDRTCGIPQLFNQHMDVCSSEESMTTGVFLKPMLPDGILFAFRSKMTTQLFCKDNDLIGPIKKLNGTGIMRLPNGCILSVTDDLGRSTKVKGPPLYRMIHAEDLNLSVNGPLGALQTLSGLNNTYKVTSHTNSLSENISSMVKQVATVDSRVRNQGQTIWIIIGSLLVIVVLLASISIIAYRHRSKFLNKIYDLRNRFAEIYRNLAANRGKLKGPLPTAPGYPMDPDQGNPKRNIYGSTSRDTTYDGKTSPHYLSMDELTPPPRGKTIDVTLSRSAVPKMQTGCPRYYPSLAPFQRDLSDFPKEGEEPAQLQKPLGRSAKI